MAQRHTLLTYMVPGFPRSLFEVIADLLDMDLAIDSTRSGPAEGEDPFADGSADIGWICSTSYVDLALRRQPPSVELSGVAWVPDDAGVADQPKYFGDLVVRSDSPHQTLDDLAGASIGCNDPISLSGHHSLRFALRDLGHEPASFAELTFTGGHFQSLEGVIDGSLDAAVIDSVVRINQSRTNPQTASLRVLERLGPWPVQPLVFATRLAPEVKQRVKTVLLAANDHPELRAELTAASLVRFAPTDHRYYDAVRAAMANDS